MIQFSQSFNLWSCLSSDQADTSVKAEQCVMLLPASPTSRPSSAPTISSPAQYWPDYKSPPPPTFMSAFLSPPPGRPLNREDDWEGGGSVQVTTVWYIFTLLHQSVHLQHISFISSNFQMQNCRMFGFYSTHSALCDEIGWTIVLSLLIYNICISTTPKLIHIYNIQCCCCVNSHNVS